jgi:hypothetical protein
MIMDWTFGTISQPQLSVLWVMSWSWAWWCTSLIPALGRERQAGFWVRGQPGLQSEFQVSQGYTEKPCLGKKKKKKKKKCLIFYFYFFLYLFYRSFVYILQLPV